MSSSRVAFKEGRLRERMAGKEHRVRRGLTAAAEKLILFSVLSVRPQ